MAPDRPQRAATPNGSRGRAPFTVIESTGPGPRLGPWLAIVGVLTGLAIAKPWGIPPPPPPPSADRGAAVVRSAAATPARPATDDPRSAGPPVASICFDPPSWRVATVEHWHDRTIRVWRAIEPVPTATGPDDQQVPVTQVVSEGVIELGWCAPVIGPVQATGGASIEVWRRTPGGATAITVTRQQPASGPSAYGALYGSPTARGAGVWKDGTYVFLHRAPDGLESWFAVDLERRPSIDTSG